MLLYCWSFWKNKLLTHTPDIFLDLPLVHDTLMMMTMLMMNLYLFVCICCVNIHLYLWCNCALWCCSLLKIRCVYILREILCWLKLQDMKVANMRRKRSWKCETENMTDKIVWYWQSFLCLRRCYAVLEAVCSGAVLAQQFWGHRPLHHRVCFLHSLKAEKIRTSYRPTFEICH